MAAKLVLILFENLFNFDHALRDSMNFIELSFFSCPDMAVYTLEEEAMAAMRDHLQVSSNQEKRAYVTLMQRLIFPNEGTTGAQTKWVTKQKVTRVTVWGQAHLLNNIRLAMIREALSLGPKYYCIIRSAAPNFGSKVLLLMNYLPAEKLSIRPLGLPLGGPFLSPHWRTRGEEISRRSIPIGEMPPLCSRCYAWWCDQRNCAANRAEQQGDN